MPVINQWDASVASRVLPVEITSPQSTSSLSYYYEIWNIFNNISINMKHHDHWNKFYNRFEIKVKDSLQYFRNNVFIRRVLNDVVNK